MFFSFLHKDNPWGLDISLLQNNNPDEVLGYFYSSYLKLPINTYLEVKRLAAQEPNQEAPLHKWMDFIDRDLGAVPDLEAMITNEYLETIGPFYYPFTNTRFYLTRTQIPQQNLLTAQDMGILADMKNQPEANQELHAYYKTRKNAKKTARTESELIKDINMCLSALREVEKLNRHMNFINKMLQNRKALVEQKDLLPLEPDCLPDKPQKDEPETAISSNLIPFNFINRKKKSGEKENNYNHHMKVYIIRYREYEKACDRYKTVLEHWSTYYRVFLDHCYEDIRYFEEQLREAEAKLHIYNSILVKSFINSNYHDIKTLSTFRYYLETGRSHTVQDCMNLYEEETRWLEIKASQERIENTIYFMQTGNENLLKAGEQVDQILKRVNDKLEEKRA